MKETDRRIRNCGKKDKFPAMVRVKGAEWKCCSYEKKKPQPDEVIKWYDARPLKWKNETSAICVNLDCKLFKECVILALVMKEKPTLRGLGRQHQRERAK
jgi:hypothetical protein